MVPPGRPCGDRISIAEHPVIGALRET